MELIQLDQCSISNPEALPQIKPREDGVYNPTTNYCISNIS